jgi:hypothetical protein
LVFSQINGFTDIPDSQLAAGQPLTDAVIQQLSANAKFAAVRAEIFDLGWYADGNVVPTPVSPVDGYAYARSECLFSLTLGSSRQPAAGFVPGQLLFPTLANSDLGSGNLIVCPYILFIDINTGAINVQMYFSGSGIAHQGSVHCLAECQRCSVEP